MRIGIREQLGVFVLVLSLGPLALLAVLTWVNSYSFVVDIKSDGLSLTASLKAAQIASDLVLLQATCGTIVTRILLQETIRSFYSSGGPAGYNWTIAEEDLSGGLSSGGLSALLQVTLFSRNQTGDRAGLLNVTTDNSGIQLPYRYPNDSYYFLGDDGLGYPPPLYPNITYTATSNPDPIDSASNETLVFAFPDFQLNQDSALFLGPLQINESYALVSLTIPLIDITKPNYVLGYVTVVAAATSLINAVQSREGLGNSGTILIVGPNRTENLFRHVDRPAAVGYTPTASQLGTAQVKYVFPPIPSPGQSDRHANYNANITSRGSSSFNMSQYSAVLDGFSKQIPTADNASSLLSTSNENGVPVAVGYARPSSLLVDWLVLVEQDHSEAWAPITKMRNILLGCVFGTVGLILLVVPLMTHFGVRPIRKLQDATQGPVPLKSGGNGLDQQSAPSNALDIKSHSLLGTGFLIRLRKLAGRSERSEVEGGEDDGRRGFRIPRRVPQGKHFITDELTELTGTFNDMSDELVRHYTILEEKVIERTRALELSMKAAEAANESKTLFIANISHELKTPLNGIMGMCAVCMGEDDLFKIKRSLQVVYKSGDLLLNLLNDLLTFSKNQIGQQLNLEEKEFHLAEVKTQITALFDKQAREKKVTLSVYFVGAGNTTGVAETSHEQSLPAVGPDGIGRLQDLCVWGDHHRILQVIINLVSNSLKFTPAGGKIDIRITCLGEAHISSDKSTDSMTSRQSSMSSSQRPRNQNRASSGSNTFHTPGERTTSADTSNGSAGIPRNSGSPRHTPSHRQSPTPALASSKRLMFDFVVEDTGPGIPIDQQQKIFQPFVQGDLGLNRKYGGTGLGLSICSQLAGLLGGTISLVSTEGVGSTFTLKIPLRVLPERSRSSSGSETRRPQGSSSTSQPTDFLTDAAMPGSSDLIRDITYKQSTAAETDTEENLHPRLLGLSQPFFTMTRTHADKVEHEQNALGAAREGSALKTRVLIAEDNLVNQEVVVRMLKLEAIYDIVVAKDGQEAYDIVKESMDKRQTFNLILMDVQMPHLDGLQSTRLIRELGYSAPIVALTALTEENNVKECYDSGMNMFLSKPLRRPALKRVLKKFAIIHEETGTSPPGADSNAPLKK